MDGLLAGKKSDVCPEKEMEQTLRVGSIYSAKDMVC